MKEIRSENSILHEHELEAIKMNQKIIKRMANNAFIIKMLYLSFSCPFLMFLGSSLLELKNQWILLWCVLTFGFWYMDAKYLQLERQFREHHKAILSGSIGYLKQFDFNPMRYKVASLLKIILSDSFSLVVYPLMLVIVGYIFFIYL